MALMQPWMGNGQQWIVHNKVINEQQVDIESAWSPVNIAIASGTIFNLSTELQQFMWRHICQDLNDTIQIIGLSGRTSNRRGPVNG